VQQQEHSSKSIPLSTSSLYTSSSMHSLPTSQPLDFAVSDSPPTHYLLPCSTQKLVFESVSFNSFQVFTKDISLSNILLFLLKIASSFTKSAGGSSVLKSCLGLCPHLAEELSQGILGLFLPGLGQKPPWRLRQVGTEQQLSCSWDGLGCRALTEKCWWCSSTEKWGTVQFTVSYVQYQRG
jgi:hypothetical protein